MKNTAYEELIHEAAKVALDMGEEWRLQHPEFMDALQACYEAETVEAERNGTKDSSS